MIAVIFASSGIQSANNGGNAQDFIIELPVPSQQTGNVSIVKSANASSVNLFQPVTYTYKVSNTGTVPLTNVTIVDDNGTPDYPYDDFAVVIGATINPNQTATYTATVIPEVNVSVANSGNGSVDDNLLLISEPASGPYAGDLVVSYVQSLQVNDNSYGTNSSATWTTLGITHQFQNLLANQNAEFRFTDQNGNIVLDFKCDYISAAASATFGNGLVAYPSGYGTRGATGGNGQLITGNLGSILFVSTTLTANLNQSPEFYQYTQNSPSSNSADFASWNQYSGYTVVIAPSAFGSMGLSNFGGVTIPSLNNTPSINGVNQPYPHIVCNTSVKNTAVVTASAAVNGQNVTLQDSADATVSVSSSNLSGACGNNCTTTAKNASKFFEKCIDKNQNIWFTSVIQLDGQVPASGVTIQVTNGTITLPGGTSIQVPNGNITFSPYTWQTSTVWVNGMWETTVPLNTHGDVFATAVAYPVPACFCPKGNVTWNATFSSTVPGVQVDWQWSAAVYEGSSQYGPPSQWYDWLGVKSSDKCDTNYRNNDCAGTPEWSKQFLCSGATGLGAKDYCGLRGGSVDVLICPPPPPKCPPPPPPHCHTPSPKPHCPPPTPQCQNGAGSGSGWF